MRKLLFVLSFLGCGAPFVYGQVAAGANAGYQTAEGRARVAQSLANPEREKEQKPRELIASIGVQKGDVVADIGTGVGFMIPYFLEAVGPQGKISSRTSSTRSKRTKLSRAGRTSKRSWADK